jgi:hypothetical protein
MADPRSSETESSRAGERRADNRRAGERRTDRRLPPPVWRRPWALVGYGVLGALLTVALFRGFAEDAPPERGEIVAVQPQPTSTVPTTPESASPQPRVGRSSADFEQLVVEGAAAKGQRVVGELACNAPTTYTLSPTDTVAAAVLALRDAESRVPGAECKWGLRGETRRGDLLLLIPPELSERFASAPIAQDEFVRRRRLTAEVEWVGRSDALALRNVGVLRDVRP